MQHNNLLCIAFKSVDSDILEVSVETVILEMRLGKSQIPK